MKDKDYEYYKMQQQDSRDSLNKALLIAIVFWSTILIAAVAGLILTFKHL